MQCKDNAEIARVAYRVAKIYYPSVQPSWRHVALLIGVAAAETGLKREVGSGGLGLWNIDLHMAHQIFQQQLYHHWWQRKRRIPWRLFQQAWQGTTSQRPFIPSQKDLRHLLVMDDEFACAMAGWMLMGKPDVPENLSEIANYWFRYYPCDHHGLNQMDFMDRWSLCHCDSMMGGLGFG